MPKTESGGKTPTRVQVPSGKGELCRGPATRGVRSHLDFSIGAGDGAHVTLLVCYF